MNFAERLKTLPPVDHLSALQLVGPDGQIVATIENRPGQAGSLAVYHALATQHGGQITPAAAALGLQWYEEHAADAQGNPGTHPNIDRLVSWSKGSVTYAAKPIRR
ncbi:MAG: DUF2322 family protein [Gammaproteobacteria bacterium]